MYVCAPRECQVLLAVMVWLQPLHTYIIQCVSSNEDIVTEIWLWSERLRELIYLSSHVVQEAIVKQSAVLSVPVVTVMSLKPIQKLFILSSKYIL